MLNFESLAPLMKATQMHQEHMDGMPVTPARNQSMMDSLQAAQSVMRGSLAAQGKSLPKVAPKRLDNSTIASMTMGKKGL